MARKSDNPSASTVAIREWMKKNNYRFLAVRMSLEMMNFVRTQGDRLRGDPNWLWGSASGYLRGLIRTAMATEKNSK